MLPIARRHARYRPAMSSIFTREHQKLGVKLQFNTQVMHLLGGPGGVESVETLDGRSLPADVVVIGIGVIPIVELAAICDLAIENGIVVDELLRTSDPHISAIGDVAAHPNPYGQEGAFVSNRCRTRPIKAGVWPRASSANRSRMKRCPGSGATKVH